MFSLYTHYTITLSQLPVPLFSQKSKKIRINRCFYLQNLQANKPIKRRESKTAVILKTRRFDNVDLAVIISSANKAAQS